MPFVYFVKAGPRSSSYGPRFQISIPDLETRVHGQFVQYLSLERPEFNPTEPSPFGAKYVVIEVEPTDPTGSLFKKQGFYVIPRLTTKQGAKLIFPQGLPPISP